MEELSENISYLLDKTQFEYSALNVLECAALLTHHAIKGRPITLTIYELSMTQCATKRGKTQSEKMSKQIISSTKPCNDVQHEWHSQVWHPEFYKTTHFP